MEARLLIYGSRTFEDENFAFDVLDAVQRRLIERGYDTFTVISGTCRGGDLIGEEWARLNGCDVVRFPADWKTHGKRAGFLRNTQMLVEGKPTHGIGFIVEGSKGAAMMSRILTSAGVPNYTPRLRQMMEV